MIVNENIDLMIKKKETSEETLELVEYFEEAFGNLLKYGVPKEEAKKIVAKVKSNLIKLNKLAEENSMEQVYIDEGRDGEDFYNYVVKELRKDEYGKRL